MDKGLWFTFCNIAFHLVRCCAMPDVIKGCKLLLRTLDVLLKDWTLAYDTERHGHAVNKNSEGGRVEHRLLHVTISTRTRMAPRRTITCRRRELGLKHVASFLEVCTTVHGGGWSVGKIRRQD